MFQAWRDTGLHYHAYEPVNAMPPRLQGQPRFVGAKGQVAHPLCPCCVIRPHNLLNVFIDIDVGLREAQKYAKVLRDEYTDYLQTSASIGMCKR